MSKRIRRRLDSSQASNNNSQGRPLGGSGSKSLTLRMGETDMINGGSVISDIIELNEEDDENAENAS